MRGPLLAGGSSANSEIITPSIPSRLWRNENERGGRGGEEKGMHEMKGRGESSKAGDEKGGVGPPGRMDARTDILASGEAVSSRIIVIDEALNGWAGLHAEQGAGRMDYELW